MATKRTPRRIKESKAGVIGAILGAILIILVNLAWISLVIWGIIELILFLKRN